ncbi:MAG: serine/threonine-protein kinase [Chloroflexota bacterium]|nr:MAG: serine/threonine-protein kinase [Chloroflexota bacterium]
MDSLPVPQVGLPPVPRSTSATQRLLAEPHPQDSCDPFATDSDAEISRLGRLALRQTPPSARDYFALGDLCAKRALAGERLSPAYVAKALQAYKRAADLAQVDSERAWARLAQANLATWAVNVAHNTPSLNNIEVALWAVAESPSEQLDAQTRHAAFELRQWHQAAQRATLPSEALSTSSAETDWLEIADEALIATEIRSPEETSSTTSEHLSRTLSANAPAQAEPEGADFQIGERIDGRYHVQRILTGGMGIIYVCLDEETETLVALKTFQARYLNDDSAKRRFENEAQLWIEMDKHPNVVRAYKVVSFGKSRQHSRPHLILEYVDGPEGLGSDLRDWIKHKRLTPQLSLEIALGVCNGMLHAVSKQAGFVHRDLKPANILVRHDLVAKVTDFGLGRALGHLTESSEMPLLSPEQLQRASGERLTEVGKVVGTRMYMAPEQYTPSLQPLDERTDIFAFGVILYEMLTGIRLFSGAVDIPTLRQLHNRPIRFPPELAEQLPAELCDLTLRCLQLQRQARPQSWQALRDELAGCYQKLTGRLPKFEVGAAALQRDELMDKAYSLTELKRYTQAAAIYDQALALDPNSAWVWARKGRLLRLLKRYAEALEHFEQALRLQPAFAWAWYNKGIVHERLEQYAEACAAYERATAINPRDPWAAYSHARLLLRLERPEAALRLVQNILDLDSEHALSHVLRGQTLLRLHKASEALAAFDRALQIDYELGEALIGRGEALKALKRDAEAVSAFMQALRVQPKDTAAWLRLADAYLEQGDAAQALSALTQASNLKPDHMGVWLRIGRLHLHHNRPDEALAAYEKALKLQPSHLSALKGKSLAMMALERYGEAIDTLKAILAQRPDDLSARMHLGMAYLRSGAVGDALSAFERALDQRSDVAWLWAKYAEALQRLGRSEAAKAAWQRALSLQPDQAWYRVALARLYAAQRCFDEALDVLESAHTAEAYVERACCLRSLDRYSEALAACAQALERAPELARAHYVRGTILEHLRRTPEALEAYENALAYAPSAVWYRLKLAELLQRLNKYEEAVEVCAEGLAAPPADAHRVAQLWAQHGESLQRLNRYAEALESLTRALQLDEQLPAAWLSIGLTYAALGRLAEALSALERATQLEPQNAWFWYHYGVVLIEYGDYPQAIRALNRALALKPNFLKAQLKRSEARKKLKRLGR